MTLKVYLTPLEATRTENDNCKWRAECEVNGKMFEAESRRGASERLFRELVKAGVADDRVEIYTGERLSLRVRSMHAAAKFTYAESAKAALRRGKFVDISARIGTTA